MDIKEMGLENAQIRLLDDLELIEEDAMGGAHWSWNLVWSSVVSLGLGNNGYVCTWTKECQKNCPAK